MTTLSVEYKSLSELTCCEHNAKIHNASQVEKIKISIQQFGFNNPIAIDSNNMIICGHGRYYAALELQLPTVPTICLDHMNEAQRRAYMIADNKLTLDTGFDEFILSNELDFLAGTDVDLSFINLGVQNLEPEFYGDDGVGRITNQSEIAKLRVSVPTLQKDAFVDWIITSIEGTEFEGNIEIR